MSAGRPRKPDEVHKLQGTYRQDRHGDPASKLNASVEQPEMPIDFRSDEIAATAWEHLVKEHAGMGILSQSFQVLMELFCRTYSKYIQAEREIQVLGIIIREPVFDRNNEQMFDPSTGRDLVRIKRNPACVESSSQLDSLKRMLPELGLTPVALSKLIVPKGDQDPLDEFLDEGAGPVAERLHDQGSKCIVESELWHNAKSTQQTAIGGSGALDGDGIL